MKIYNHLVDIAFSIDTPIDKFENIPLDALILALQRRVAAIARSRERDAFGEVGDVYEWDYEWHAGEHLHPGAAYRCSTNHGQQPGSIAQALCQKYN